MIDHFDPYNVLLAIASNIPVLLMTGFVVQGHICSVYHNRLYGYLYFIFSIVLYLIFEFPIPEQIWDSFLGHEALSTSHITQ